MNTLVLDTGSETLSVGLCIGQAYYENRRIIGLRHAEQLMPIISSLIEEAGISPSQLELIVCASGPGSFTGLRIGMSTAKGIAVGSGASVVSVPTLDAFGEAEIFFDGAVIPVIDARKSRFYCAAYVNGNLHTDYLDISQQQIIELASTYDRALITGPDSNTFDDINGSNVLIDSGLCRSIGPALAKLGVEKLSENGADARDAGPMYLRRSEAEIGINRKDKHE